ncbi:transporter substrate-binding domain-containing protein [Terrisporobacter petrolearius]|uniref:transporter substrate-binding domain-containing protein n=1 Tax=Terrisporobacter petrolearius TaxID=1460447 RepID=UPI0022E8E247|nr:transporter substrate-binding domain-containing protein [Terrisporobacter petrolearius]
MKKKLAKLILMTTMILSLVGCSNGETNKSEKDTEAKKIVVASGNSSIPNSYIENDVHKGHEVDIWNAISEKTGLEVEFITGEFNSLFGYLDSGKANTVGNTITKNEDRVKKYNFTQPYAYITENLLVHSDKTDITKLKDIDGLVCGYASGSNGGNLFNQIAEKEGINVDLQVFDSSELLNEAFKQNKVDVMILSSAEASYKIKEGILDARQVEEYITVGEKAYPFVKDNKDSDKLREIVDNAITELKKDGTLSKIYEKWYGADYINVPKGYKSTFE